MKYDVLHDFRERLEQEPFSENTRKQYYAFTKKVLGGLDWNTAGDIDPAAVRVALSALKTSNDVSAARNGLLLFSRYYPECRLRALPTANELRKRNRAKREWDPLELETVKRKINGLPNEGDRLAYRIMLATGMRVSEAAALYPADIKVAVTTSSNNRQVLLFELRHTKKGGSDVAYTDDLYLLEHLPTFTADKPAEVPLFKSCQTLKNQAVTLGFECHDLRRAFACKRYTEAKQTLDRDEALDQVREDLRHNSKRTTRRYLRRKIHTKKHFQHIMPEVDGEAVNDC